MFTVKIAKESDLHTINELAAQIWAPTYGGILSGEQLQYMFDMMYSIDSLQEQLLQKKHVFFIFYLEGDPVGYLSIEQKTESLFNFQKIYALPHIQGKGLGRFMVNTGIAYTKDVCKISPYTIELCVNRDNPAVDFYKHIGFEIAGERDFHIGNDFYMNDYIMEIVCE